MMAIYISAIVFPIPVSWVWGEGWLEQMGVLDFAGSGVVHALAGVIGLTGTLTVGPRLGVFPGKLNLEQMGALYMQGGETINLDDQYVNLIHSKQEVFKHGYKQPTFTNIKFQNTVDQAQRWKIKDMEDQQDRGRKRAEGKNKENAQQKEEKNSEALTMQQYKNHQWMTQNQNSAAVGTPAPPGAPVPDA